MSFEGYAEQVLPLLYALPGVVRAMAQSAPMPEQYGQTLFRLEVQDERGVWFDNEFVISKRDAFWMHDHFHEYVMDLTRQRIEMIQKEMASGGDYKVYVEATMKPAPDEPTDDTADDIIIVEGGRDNG